MVIKVKELVQELITKMNKFYKYALMINVIKLPGGHVQNA